MICNNDNFDIIEISREDATNANVVYPKNTLIKVYENSQETRLADGITKFNDLLVLGSSGGGGGSTDASQLTTGTLSDARLSNNVALKSYVTKANVGLGNVDNTADSAKPISTAQQTALNLKANTANQDFTGINTVPTPATSTNTTQIANAALVQAVAALKQNVLTAGFNLGTINGISFNFGQNTVISAIQAASLGYIQASTIGYVADGTTDNTPKYEGTTKVYFGPGTYLFKSTLYLGGGIDFLGDGNGKTIFKTNTTFTGGNGDAPFEHNGGSNIKYRCITFNGSGNAVPASSQSKRMLAFIKFNPFPNLCKNILVEDCVFQDGWCYGIRFGDGNTDGTNMYENIDINRNTFERLYDPNHPEFDDEVDSQDNFMKCDGLYLNSLTKKANITNNRFMDLSGDAIFGFGSTNAGANNYLVDDQWRAFNISHNFIYKTWMGIEINGNTNTSNKSIIHNNIILYPRRINSGGYCVSVAGDGSIISNNICVATEMATFEIFGNNTQIIDNKIMMSVLKNGSGGVASTKFRAGGTHFLMDVYGCGVDIKNNLLVADLKYDNGTIHPQAFGGINIINVSPYSPPYQGGTVKETRPKDYNISGNTIVGIKKSFIEATVQPADDITIAYNKFVSKNLTESGIWIQGSRWNIHHNDADLTGSSNGYTDGIGFVQTHNTVTATQSLVHHNSIINDEFFFPTNTRGYFKYWANEFHNSTTRIGWTDCPYFPVTASERAALPVGNGRNTTVFQTDGATAIGPWTYVNGAWKQL